MSPLGRVAPASLLLGGLLWLSTGPPALGQFMRIGPFDLNLSTDLSVEYTTNVEQERESEATAEREDLFFTYGFALGALAELGRGQKLELSTDFEWEHHVNRSDLNETGDIDPLGLASIQYAVGREPLDLLLLASYDRSLETSETTFVGGSRKKRDDNTIIDYGVTANYSRNRLQAGFTFNSSRERHADPEFQDGDKDSDTITFDVAVKLSERSRALYGFSSDREDILQDTDDFTGWEDTHAFGLAVDLWRRPLVTYTLGYEKEAMQEDKGQWEITHKVSVSDDRKLTDTLTLTLFAEYNFEEMMENDDITLTYGFSLGHAISSTANQTFRATREPLDTLGSTTTTESTEFGYSFSKSSFLLPDIILSLTLNYSIDSPSDPDIEEEKSLDSSFVVSQTRKVWGKLSRGLEYQYTFEDSNLESEILEEHRVELSYIYTF